jgi:hypothetical protein
MLLVSCMRDVWSSGSSLIVSFVFPLKSAY